ncbi:MAG: excinuclease ABC subunit UvrC [Bacillota bacterium]|nr:excinuclease ABC subunit UvrC [Bacillota bacterium]
MNSKILELRKKSMKLPLSPGVYIMRDKNGNVIYVGKAKALKNRVSQYFGSQKNHQEKVRRMVENVEDFEYIIADSENEALALENSLIKLHQPKYNILLKDDKGYNYVRISNEPWRRLSHVFQKADDGAEYIGPYTSSFYVRNSLDEAKKIFKLPDCTRRFPQDFGKGRPCLNYHIKQCCAPCRGKMTLKEYNEYVDDAIDFLKAGGNASLSGLQKKMEQAAENMEYEHAAKIRDRISMIKKMSQKQKTVSAAVKEQDIIAFSGDSSGGCFEVFRFNGGRLTDREDFIIDDVGEISEARSEFISRYYSMRNNIPKIIALDGEIQDAEVLASWLSEKAHHKVRLTIPQRGEQAELVAMCKNNAAERIAQTKGVTGKELSVLEELKEVLGLLKIPEYIEAYDISNTSGSENVAGMVVYENSRPLKSAYRKFKIKSFQGQDDYASMNEVLTRRFEEYKKHKESGEGFGRLPDLILLDGGKGQITAVKPVLEAKGINVPLFGMVKDSRHHTRAIASDGGEIVINSKRRVFTFISNIQDEVHRFAIGYHRQKRSKSAFSSSLTEIDGIGATRAKALLKYFKTVKRISEAELKELEGAPTMNKYTAKAVYKYFHNNKENV